MINNSLFKSAENCILACEPAAKLALTRETANAWIDQHLSLEGVAPILVFESPGRPEKPELVSPKHLNRRKASSKVGHAALIHSICHIEFNAINLAWDAIYRFQDMPVKYYQDWIKVATEEAYHFELLQNHLTSLGHKYGDFTAHNGLWESALLTAHDPLIRMALVPRVLEARGLDVTPGIVKKLKDIKDEQAVKILEIIFRDEIGHVETGSYWFRYLCEKRKLDSEQTFKQLINEYMKGSIRGPFDRDTRKRAGFTEEELNYLENSV